MRAFAAASALVLIGVSAVALAQPRAFIRPARDSRDSRPTTQTSTPQMCTSRRNVMSSEEQRFQSYQSELAGVEAELGAVQRRLDELRRRRDDLRREVSATERRVRSFGDSYRRDCNDTENCDAYDQRADELDRQNQSTFASLEVVRNDIKQNREEVARLQLRIDPLAREYTDKKCNALVPGETPDAVAQRCLEIFMDWNKTQADINRANNRMPELRSRYEQWNNELASAEKRAQGYESYMAKNCTASARLVKVRENSSVRTRATTIGQELDALVTDITRLRGVKITVTAQ
jgi:chromosome segregation ATPase